MDTLSRDATHRVHEFLRVAEVCRLRTVCSSWRDRHTAALESDFLWDLTHCVDADAEGHWWLYHILNANVRVRSIGVVCQLF